MSDTTPSAKNVADHLDSEQEDCSMHLLNLCIAYGVGLKDNIQTNTVWGCERGSWDKAVAFVTPGGALDEGGSVIQKLRSLNNYFKSTKQLHALKMIQQALSYPEPQPLTDSDFRVAYTCKLIRRSIVNYSAFDAYFQSHPASVWSTLTAKDWMLAAEMEAVANDIVRLALVEAQSENFVSSYMVVFRRLTENKLKSYNFEMMLFGQKKKMKRHIAEYCGPLTNFRIPVRRASGEHSCNCRHASRKSRQTPWREEKALYARGLDFVREEHRQIFATMARTSKIALSQDYGSQSSSMNSQDMSPFSSPSSTGWDEGDELLLGAPIRLNQNREEVKEHEIEARADRVLNEWLELEMDWLEIALQQKSTKNREELDKDMYIHKPKGKYWALLGLYKHVDILQWFRDEGEERFPSIALLARIHLGKVSSSAFQERVFSSGGIVMGPLRTTTDNRRAEKQLLLKHNRNEIVLMKQDAREASEPLET